jgi:sugar phosphate isomerase/epimerase
VRISNQTYELAKAFGYEGAVRLNCEAGFEAIDFTMYKRSEAIFSPKREKTIAEMKNIAQSFGAVFNQAHAPFPHVLKTDLHFNSEENREAHECVRESIRIAGELGCERIIVHPIYFKDTAPEENTEKNIELFRDLIDLARECRVQIAIENMWGRHRDINSKIIPNVASTGRAFADFIDAFHKEFGNNSVTACLDVGHANMVGVDPADSIRTLGREHLGALHIHDNFGLRDLHLLPYTGAIKWDTITDALAEINYDGDMTLEIVGYVARLPLDMLPEGLRLAESVGRRLIREIEEKKRA